MSLSPFSRDDRSDSSGSGAPGGTAPGNQRLLLPAQALMLIALVLTGFSLLALSVLTLPVKTSGVVSALAAIVLFIVALAKTPRATRKAGLIVSVVLCMVLNAVLALLLGVWALMAPLTGPYEQCVKSALTDSARTECEDKLMDSLTRLGAPPRQR